MVLMYLHFRFDAVRDGDGQTGDRQRQTLHKCPEQLQHALTSALQVEHWWSSRRVCHTLQVCCSMKDATAACSDFTFMNHIWCELLDNNIITYETHFFVKMFTHKVKSVCSWPADTDQTEKNSWNVVKSTVSISLWKIYYRWKLI